MTRGAALAIAAVAAALTVVSPSASARAGPRTGASTQDQQGVRRIDLEGRHPEMSLSPANYEQVVKQGLRYQRSVPLYHVAYAYDPTRGKGGDTDVVLHAQVWSGEKLQGVSPVLAVPSDEKGGSPPPMTSRIALEGLASGDYELRILVSDRKADVTALRRIGFSIE